MLEDALSRLLEEGIRSPADDYERQVFPERCVLSPSGLRFIVSENGNEADLSPRLPKEVQDFVLAATWHLAGLIQERGDEGPVMVGSDTRPTGAEIEVLVEGALRARGLKVGRLRRCPIPMALAATHQLKGSGFVYVTASHNPPGHNGLKLGLRDGAVLKSSLAKALIRKTLDTLKNRWELSAIRDKTAHALAIPKNFFEMQEQARQAYRKFALDTASGGEGELFSKQLNECLSAEKPVLVIDMNGSSRLLGPDVELLESLGLEVEIIGGKPGVFSHAIVPEGESLEPARKRVQELLDSGKNVFGALVPDCDGDRGNLVLPLHGKARSLRAQETFALVAIAVASMCDGENIAIAANGATSMMIDELLQPLGVKVCRAETGEANVLALAKHLREEGYTVPLSGEGSNGGSILHPSTVRDPMMTLLALLRFSCLKDENGETALRRFARRTNCKATSIPEMLNCLPVWKTTDAFDSDALMPVPKVPHESLKRNWEGLVMKHFEEEPLFWESLGVKSVSIVSYEGSRMITGPGGRPEPGKGGIAARFMGENRNLGFFWMRGSGTEPVFRLVVNWGGDPAVYPRLLQLHRSLISKAIQASKGKS